MKKLILVFILMSLLVSCWEEIKEKTDVENIKNVEKEVVNKIENKEEEKNKVEEKALNSKRIINIWWENFELYSSKITEWLEWDYIYDWMFINWRAFSEVY